MQIHIQTMCTHTRTHRQGADASAVSSSSHIHSQGGEESDEVIISARDMDTRIVRALSDDPDASDTYMHGGDQDAYVYSRDDSGSEGSHRHEAGGSSRADHEGDAAPESREGDGAGTANICTSARQAGRSDKHAGGASHLKPNFKVAQTGQSIKASGSGGTRAPHSTVRKAEARVQGGGKQGRQERPERDAQGSESEGGLEYAVAQQEDGTVYEGCVRQGAVHTSACCLHFPCICHFFKVVHAGSSLKSRHIGV
jgi:hypothetical protein